MGEKRTLNLVVCEEKDLGSGKKLYKLTTQDGKHYDCWDAKIKEFVGKGPREYEVFSKQRGEYTDWYITLDGGRAGRGGAPGGGSRGYVVSFRDTREGAILSAKTMVLSYAKDLVAAAAPPKTMEIEGMVRNTEEAYRDLLKLLDLDGLPKETAPAPGEKNGGSGIKSLAILKAEIQVLPSVPAFSTWWNNNQASIKALSLQDRGILFEAKADRIRELEGASDPGVPDEGEIPF